MKEENRFLEGEILPSILKFTIPILFALLLQAAYGSVDMWVVGKYCGSADISAVATGSQVMFMITGLINGLSVGSTIVIAKNYARKEDENVANALGSTARIFGLLAIILTAIFVPFAPQIATLANAPSDAFIKTVNYIMICAGGTIFITGFNVLSAIFRGFGNSKIPLLFVAIACAANVILDLLFVAVMGMDASGTALATVISQASSVVFSIVYLKKRGFPVKFTKANLKRNKEIEIEIIKVGTPLALQTFFSSFSFLIITSLANSLGLVASASVGVAEKIVTFMFLIPQSFSSAISTFTAQNVGVLQYKRAKQGVWSSTCITVFVGFAMFYLGFFHGDILIKIFTEDTAVVASATLFLMATSIESFCASSASGFLGYLNGNGRTTFVMVQGLVATFLVRIPIAYFVVNSSNPTMFRLGLSATSAALFSLIACVTYYFIVNEKIVSENSQK